MSQVQTARECKSQIAMFDRGFVPVVQKRTENIRSQRVVKRHREIVGFLMEQYEPVDTETIAQEIGESEATIKTDLQTLMVRGLILRLGESRRGVRNLWVAA
jgi:predicted HTH transcriptional regulator